MNNQRLHTAIGPLLRAAHRRDAEEQRDGSLLTRFVRHGDEAAFAVLVRRHGPMVLGVCRRMLGNAADADDAFQATFLVLVRRASSLAARPVLGDYLHGMARRTALKARTAAAHRRFKERQTARPVAAPAEPRNDYLPLLDDALSRLPEKYRLPIVLCDLEGRTRREAATQLGWAEGTVAGRLARGRELLAKRLLRGVAFASGAVPGLLAAARAQASLPPVLMNATIQAATAPTAASAQTLILAKGVLQSMLWNKIKVGVIVVLATVVTAGVGGLTYRVTAGGGQPQPATQGRTNAEPGERTQTRPAGDAPPKKRPPVVRELDLRGFPADKTDTKNQRQTILDNADQLAQTVPDKEWQAKIAKQVDFDNERLLFFIWIGGPNDKLTFTVEETKTGPVVVFRYRYSLASVTYTVCHAHLFVLDKDVRFKVAGDEKEPPAAREIDLKGYSAAKPEGMYGKPAILTTPVELAKAIPDKEWQARIAAQVDFAKERLLFFAWTGAPGEMLQLTIEDRLLHTEEGKTGPIVVFHHWAGRTSEIYVTPAYFHLFAVGKNATCQNEEDTKPPFAEPGGPGSVRDVPTSAVPGGPVKVLRADATIELHGVLAYTPKGVFLLVKEGSPTGAETTTWELDVSKLPELDKQAKELSGKAVVATGTCQMARVLPKPYGGAAEPFTPGEGRWELQKVVVISKLTTEK